jgi:MoaA/NifB/PqqE/SkfB family radical SAM enzyme
VHALGTYPTNSVEEMWYGPRANELRAHLRANVLPAGCDTCWQQLHSRNFAGLRARAFDYVSSPAYEERNGEHAAKPTMLEFEISNVCNLECTMCNGFFSSLIRKNREKLPALHNPYDDQFVTQLEPFLSSLREAKFLGGEPFLVSTYYQIWDRLIRLNPEALLTVTTNGTILNERVKRTLDALKFGVVVSVDSLEQGTYEGIRVNASFITMMKHVEYFKEYTTKKQTTLSFAVCPMQQNWRGMPRFLQYCNDNGISLYFNTVTWPRENALMYLSRSELNEVVRYLDSYNPLAGGKKSQLIPSSDPVLEDLRKLRADNELAYDGLVHQVMHYRDHPAAE